MGEEQCDKAEVDCADFDILRGGASCQPQKPEHINLGSWFELSLVERQIKKEDITLQMTEHAKTMTMCMCCSSKTSPLASIESEPDEEVEKEANEEAEEEAGEVELDILAKTLAEEEEAQ